MALPEEQEESDPAFVHHSADELPMIGPQSFLAPLAANEPGLSSSSSIP